MPTPRDDPSARGNTSVTPERDRLHEEVENAALHLALESDELRTELRDWGSPREVAERATTELETVWLRPPDTWRRLVEADARLALEVDKSRRLKVQTSRAEIQERLRIRWVRALPVMGIGITIAAGLLGGAFALSGAYTVALAAAAAVVCAAAVGLAVRVVRRPRIDLADFDRKVEEGSASIIQGVKDPLVEEHTRARNAAREAAIADVAELQKAALRRYVDGLDESSYSTRLEEPLSIKGLSRLPPDDLLIDGAAIRQVIDYIDTLDTAAIGVAGRRGSGKTTLIDWFCGLPSLGETEIVAVKLDAPVDYDSRDFLMHLFATLCLRFGARDRLPDHRDPPAAPSGSESPMSPMGLVSLLVAITGVASALLGTFSIVGRRSIDLTYIALVGGAVLAVLGVLLFRQDYRKRLDDRRHQAATTYRHKEWERHANDLLAPTAQDHLDNLRFQQSHSWGWSGKLSLGAGSVAPIGIETSATQSRQRTWIPHTLPKVVDDLRAMLRSATSDGHHKVLICIDEMDKLGSGDAATTFIDDIKVVFGVPGTFCLVSVSEDAIRSFEQRGLPFRNSFDSAFDEMVSVEAEGFASTRSLLAARVIGLPLPYSMYCHVASGGLPRDAIRVARKVCSSAPESFDASISRLTSSDVAEQARSRATEIALTQFGRDASAAVVWCSGVEDGVARVCGDLSELSPVLLTAYRAGTELLRALQGLSAATPELRRQVLDLVCFIYWSIAVASYFDSSGREDRLRADHELGGEQAGFELLARARSSFSLHPRLAWTLASKVLLVHSAETSLPNPFDD